MKNSTSGLRFAALVRVSTEAQEQKGESLRTQRKQLIEAVNRFGGHIPDDGWYSGQEHSSAGYEHKILKKLLADSATGKFDAVIVTDLSRLGRDMLTSVGALDELSQNRIKVYDANGEISLGTSIGRLNVNLQTAIHQYFVDQNTEKSLANKRELAKRGWPLTKSLPHGRRVKAAKDKSGYAEWEVDPVAYEQVQRLWKMYVEEGHCFEKIERLTGIDRTQVRKLLLFGCGDTWVQTIKGEAFPVKVPPLLTNDQIQATRLRAKSNQQFKRSRYPYPLTGYVRCAVCGDAMTGQSSNHQTNLRRYCPVNW